MFFNARKNGYDAGDGPIRYLDGSSLARPLEAPRPQMLAMAAFVLAAAVIGGVFLFNVIDNVTHSAERTRATVEQNLARPASMASLPNLASLVGLDAEGVKAAFAESGWSIADKGALSGDESGNLDLIKLPDDVSEAQALLMYSNVSGLSAADATLLLNGSWQFTSEAGGSANMRVKYADFSSGSVEAAVQTAIASEGFDPATAGEMAVDESGNTFQEGPVAAGDGTYHWRVSAIKLSSVYDIKGLPDTAVYVGIRLYA